MIFARFEKRGPAGRERDDFPTSLRCRRLAVGMGRSDLAEFLEVPITAVRNWERGKSRPADSQAVLDRLTKIQENLERVYLDVDSGGEQMLWVEETDFQITVNSEEAGARLFFLHAPHAMGIRAFNGKVYLRKHSILRLSGSHCPPRRAI